MELNVLKKKPQRTFDKNIYDKYFAKTVDYDSDDLNDLNNFKLKTKNSIRPRTFTKKSKRKNYESSNRTSKRDLIGISEGLTDNSTSINRILSNHDTDNNINDADPEYIYQFDAQTFDAIGSPSAPNDTYATNDKAKLLDLERQLSYQGGWSQVIGNALNDPESMTYGVVSGDQFTHNNQTPFFSTKNGYGSNDFHNDHVTDFKNDLYTGNMQESWRKKQANSPLFAPMANLTYMDGAPNICDEERSRCVVSSFRQGESFGDPIRVTPGIGLGANENATHGYHPTYRYLGKTIDELRVKPRTSLEGRVIESGQRGQARPIQAPVVQYKPDTFQTKNSEDLIPTHNIVDGPKSRENIIMRETDRSHQSIEYTGGAFVSQDTVGRNVPEYMRPKIKESTRQNYTNPVPQQKFSREGAIYNANHDSYNLASTLKDQTIENNHTGTIAQMLSSYTHDNNQLKSTLKDLYMASTQPIIHTTIMPNTMRGTAHPMDVLNTTLKDTTCVNLLNPYAKSLIEGPQVYSTDIAKTTMRQLNAEQPIIASNVGQNINLYTELQDCVRTTNRETMIEASGPLVAIPINQQQRAPDPQDTFRTTNRQTLIESSRPLAALPIGQQQRAPDPQDTFRTTNRQTLIESPRPLAAIPVGQQQTAPNPQDTFKTTNRETLIESSRPLVAIPVGQQQRVPNPQDIFRTTNRETLVDSKREMAATPIGQQQRAPDPQDVLRTTQRETLVDSKRELSAMPVNQQQRAPDPLDNFRTTTREQSVQTPWNTFVVPVNQQQRAPDPQDIFRTTNRETLVDSKRELSAVPVNQHQGITSTYNRDPLRTTSKESLVDIPYNININTNNQRQGTASAYNRDPLRTTTRESLIEIPYNTHTTGVYNQQGTASSHNRDPLHTTIRETLVDIPYNTYINSINQQGTASSHNRAPLRTTNKEGLLEIPYNTYVNSIEQNQGVASSHNREPLRNTIREDLVEIPHKTFINSIDNQQGIASTYNRSALKTTNKEGLIEIPTNTHVGTINKSASANNADPLRSTIRETLIDNEYLAPIQGENRHKSYYDAYNITIDDKKESVIHNREPTTCNINLGPDVNNVHYQFKSDNNESQRPMIGYSINNKLDRPKTIYTSKNNSCQSERFIDPILLKQLESNPFTIKN